MDTAIKHPVPDRVQHSDAQPWASECLDVKITNVA